MKNIDELRSEILSDAVSCNQKNRYIYAADKFKEYFGTADVEVFSAPGRCEIIGNHTDHQLGKVLATSVSADIIAVVSERDDNVVSVVSDSYGGSIIDTSSLDVVESEKGTTESLIRGVLAGLAQRGYKIGGFNAFVTSDVLSGSGLSSSAAFEILIGTILSYIYNASKVDPVTLAVVGQYAENKYFGKPCGLMDQLACSVGGIIDIDFSGGGNPSVIKCDCDFSKMGYSLCVCDTGGSHDNLTDEYAEIPFEMKKVAQFFGKEYLGEVGYCEFTDKLEGLRKQLGDRSILRAFHFFEENNRVEKALGALKENNIEKFLGSVKESGTSSYKYLQNVYVNGNTQEQSIPMALALSEYLLKDRGVCRVHGGGFAGTILAFVKNEYVSEYKTEYERVFGENTCMIMHVRNVGGIRVMG